MGTTATAYASTCDRCGKADTSTEALPSGWAQVFRSTVGRAGPQAATMCPACLEAYTTFWVEVVP